MPAIYTEADYTAISAQHKKRWLALAIPCVLLLAVLIYSLCVRIEWLTSVSTILIGVILIAGYDFAIKPIFCYQRHLNHCLHGRTRDCELPFIRLSENIDVWTACASASCSARTWTARTVPTSACSTSMRRRNSLL